VLDNNKSPLTLNAHCQEEKNDSRPDSGKCDQDLLKISVFQFNYQENAETFAEKSSEAGLQY